VETHVVQPSSVPVDRRARRAKSDGIDAELLLRTLLAWLRGEPRVCSMVPTPTEADEDERRRVREREDLVADRVSLVNRIGGVLATLGGMTTIPSGGIGGRALGPCGQHSEVHFRRTPAPGYFACSTAWIWYVRKSPNWSRSATRYSRKKLPIRRKR
jgi:hypothetical protein